MNLNLGQKKSLILGSEYEKGIKEKRAKDGHFFFGFRFTLTGGRKGKM